MIRRMRDFIQEHMRNLKKYIARKIWDKKNTIYDLKLDKDNFITNNGIKSILIMRDDGKIGDMVVNTFVFREIKKKYPDIKIGVVTRKVAKEIIRYNSNIDNIYEYKKNFNYLKKLGKKIEIEKYDLLVDFSLELREHQIMFINKCKCRINMGIDKKNWNLFDISINDIKNEHITKRFCSVLEFLGVNNIDTSYEITIPNHIKNKIEYEIRNDYPIAILNPFAASKHRSFNMETIKNILDLMLTYTKCNIYIIGESKYSCYIEEIVKKYGKKRVIYLRLNNILEVAFLIKKSQLVITPDTSIVHIASAFKVRQIDIYRQDKNDNNSVLWGPNSIFATQIFTNGIEVTENEEDINNFEIKEVERILFEYGKEKSIIL